MDFKLPAEHDDSTERPQAIRDLEAQIKNQRLVILIVFVLTAHGAVRESGTILPWWFGLILAAGLIYQQMKLRKQLEAEQRTLATETKPSGPVGGVEESDVEPADR